MGELKEKCAVVGAYSREGDMQAADLAYEGLRLLQHRGEEASGIASQVEPGNLRSIRSHGYVPDVFTDGSRLRELPGLQAIGHNRYSTNGNPSLHLQPVLDEPLGFAMAHNGNLPTTDSLDDYLQHHRVNLNGMNDSERMAHAVAQAIRNGADLPDAIRNITERTTGAYSAVALHDGMVVAFRDPHGIRPLSLANFKGNTVVASETCVFNALAAEGIRDIQPGELAIITNEGTEYIQFAEPNPKLDIFELVYFARPDSVLYGQQVSAVRYSFGEQLAQECPPLRLVNLRIF